MSKKISQETAKTVLVMLGFSLVMLGPISYLTNGIEDKTFSAILTGIVSSIGFLVIGMVFALEPRKSDKTIEEMNTKIDGIKKDIDEIKKNIGIPKSLE